jgi:hypothetical protein
MARKNRFTPRMGKDKDQDPRPHNFAPPGAPVNFRGGSAAMSQHPLETPSKGGGDGHRNEGRR